MKRKALVLVVLLGLLLSVGAAAFDFSSPISVKKASYYWTVATHPVEALTHALTGRNTMAELQHCVPQSLGGSHDTTAYWARSNHTVSDRWGGKRFLRKPHGNPVAVLMTLGNGRSRTSLNAAYRMGAYGLPYTVFFHHYHRDESRFLFTRLDGPSMLVYGVSWLFNMPQKLVNQVAYIVESGTEPNFFYLIDVVLALFVAVVDLALAVVFTGIGFVGGFVLHPIQSLCSLVGMFYFFVPAFWTAIAELLLGVARIFGLG